MSRSKLRHCRSGILAVGALLLSAWADMIRAASSTAPTETYRATEVISHVLGSKQAIGYFHAVNGQCELTLIVAEAV